MSARDFDSNPQPSTHADKVETVKGAFGADSKGNVHPSQFRTLRIERAENGVSVDHTHAHSHPPKNRGEGGMSVPSSGDHTHTAHIIIPNDHPIMKHVQAIHDHVANQSDCAAGSGHCKG